MRFWSVWFFLLGMIFLLGRCTPQGLCVPGHQKSCHCVEQSDLLLGVQICEPNGNRWLSCQCSHQPKNPSLPEYSISEPSEMLGEPLKEQAEPSTIDSSKRPQEPFWVSDAGEPKREQQTERLPEKRALEKGQNTLRVAADLWPGGAQSAVSFTVDEGVASPYKLLAPELERRGWRATFYIYTLQPTVEKTWDLLRAAHKRGHEISSHTHTHPDLTKINQQRIHSEMKACAAELRKQIAPDLLLLSFAYPFENTDARVWSIVKQYHRYARGGDHGAPVPPNPVPLNDPRQPEWGNLKSKAPTRAYTVTQWNTWIDAAVKQKKWLIEELHGVEKQGWEPRTLDEYKAHFSHIESYGSKIWVGTVADVGRYIEERESVTFQWLKQEPKELLLKVDDSLVQPYFNLPLSYVIQTPTNWGWRRIKVSQGGRPMRVTVLGPGYFRTESVPDASKIVRITPRQ